MNAARGWNSIFVYYVYLVFSIYNVGAITCPRFGSPLTIPSCFISGFPRFPFATAESIEDLQQRQRHLLGQHQATPVREPLPRPGLAPFPSRVLSSEQTMSRSHGHERRDRPRDLPRPRPIRNQQGRNNGA